MKHLILLAVLISSLAFAQEKRDENEIVLVGTTDPDMISAIKQARSTLNEFLVLSLNPPPNTTGFKLKVMVKDGANTEHFWVIPFRQTSSGFEGILANDPQTVRNVKGGQLLSFQRDVISDWGYIKDGRQVGSFTVCALFKKMPKEQSDYYRKNHGFDC
jgi:uncharacterized protein YegJ (DUF2314 family)